MKNIIFICTGNTCRSPMADGIFKNKCRELELEYSSKSRGLYTNNGLAPSENAVIACNEIGIDISAHRSKMLVKNDIKDTELFVVMTESHRFTLLNYRIPKSKIYILNGGIPDPYGGDLEVYRDCRDSIEKGIDELIRILEEKN